MLAVARLTPFETKPALRFDWTPGESLMAIAKRAVAMAGERDGADYQWFMEHGTIRLNGRQYDREFWPLYKVKKHDVLIELCVTVHGGKSSGALLLLAAVALTVVTGGIGAGALGGVLGSGFAAGTLGASALAAGVGIVGQLALKALTPSPAKAAQASGVTNELSQSGATSNILSFDTTLYGILGRRRVSPPIVSPPYVTLEYGKTYTEVTYGLMGRNLVEDILINDVSYADIPGVVVTTQEGDGGGDEVLFPVIRVMDEKQRGVVISNFDLQSEVGTESRLVDQALPDNSLSKWHSLATKGNWNKFTIRLLFEGGIVDAAGNDHGVAFRIEIKPKASGTWRKLPVAHFHDPLMRGGFRQELRIVRGFVNGQWANKETGAAEFNCFGVSWKTGSGQTFQYDADSYFDPATATTITHTPTMTAATTGGITVSASHNSSTAWRTIDGNTGTQWVPPTNSISAVGGLWWKIDWGAGNEKNVCRYGMQFCSTGEDPTRFKIEGSQDDVTYDLLDETDPREDPILDSLRSIANTTAYRYYKITITANDGAANEAISIGRMHLLGNRLTTGVGTGNLANNVMVTYDGVTFNLDPDTWPDGEYDIRIKRSWAFQFSDVALTGSTYTYNAAAASASFFEYYLSGTRYLVREAQKDIQSKVVIEAIAIEENSIALRQDVAARMTLITIKAPDIVLQSVSGLLTSYARIWDGSVWVDTPVPARNPAALYRDALLLLDKNAMPLPGEILDEESLQTWFDFCETEGLTCDAIVQDRSLSDVLDLLASAGRASPRRTDRWGVVIDRDRSADAPTAILTPENSRNLGIQVNYPEVPDAFYVTFVDEDLGYAEREITVYRDGVVADDARLFEAVTYPHCTTEAAATAQATYDLRQAWWRNVSFRYEVGAEGLAYARGELFGLADEVVSRDAYFGLSESTTVDGSDNLTGLSLYSTVRLSESVDAISETEGVPGTFGAMIRKTDGTTVTRQINEIADTNTITFTVHAGPVTDYDLQQPVAIGPLGREVLRVILHAKEQSGEGRWTLTLLPEAPEIFA